MYLFFATLVCRDWDSNSQPSACVANALTLCATVADATSLKWPKQNPHIIYLIITNVRIILLHMQMRLAILDSDNV